MKGVWKYRVRLSNISIVSRNKSEIIIDLENKIFIIKLKNKQKCLKMIRHSSLQISSICIYG